MEEKKTYRIPEGNMDNLLSRIEKLNRRARRLGMTEIVLQTIGTEMVEYKRRAAPGEGEDLYTVEGGRKVVTEFRKVFLVQVDGVAPKIAGWTFVATLQHEQGGNILRSLPGHETTLPLKYRTAGTDCDHCGFDRRRRDTYVLLSETGEYKQVGRSCLRDFLGHTNPETYAEWAETIAELDGLVSSHEEEGFGGSTGAKYYSLESLLTLTRRVIRAHGWVSRKTSQEKSTEDNYFPSTASRVGELLQDGSSKGKKRAWEQLAELAPVPEGGVEPKDHEDAVASILWAKALPQDINNDYQWNLRLLANSEQISPRSMGLACSMVSAWMRDQDRMSEIVRKSKGGRPSEFFGEVKKRGDFLLTVTRVHEYESNFGVKTLITFEDKEGNRAKWFASGSVANSWDHTKQELVPVWEEGKTYQVKATPKEHSVWKGQKETTLSRCVNDGEVITVDLAPKMIESPQEDI